MKYLVYTLLLIALVSCNLSPTTHPRLLEWDSEFVMDDGEENLGYSNNHEAFIKPYFEVQYDADTILVTTLLRVNACADKIGDIKIENDTIRLFSVRYGSIECTSRSFIKSHYKILNEENTEYHFISVP
jgi:hypothetical protein